MSVARCVLGICTFLLFSIGASQGYLYPNFFTNYRETMHLVSPAFLPNNTNFDVFSNYRSLSGDFKNISGYTFSAAKLWQSKNKLKHQLRLQFVNEKEGSYITYPKIYAGYAVEIPITDDIQISAGTYLGFAGIYYAAPTVTEASGMLPDGAVGIGTQLRNIKILLSSNQIFNNSLNKESIKLGRYYQGLLNWDIPINHKWIWALNTLARELPYATNEYYAGTAISFNKIFEIGSNYKFNGGLSFYSSVDCTLQEEKLKIYFNYNSSAFKLNPTWLNGIELGLRYRILNAASK